MRANYPEGSKACNYYKIPFLSIWLYVGLNGSKTYAGRNPDGSLKHHQTTKWLEMGWQWENPKYSDNPEFSLYYTGFAE